MNKYKDEWIKKDIWTSKKKNEWIKWLIYK